MKSVPILLLVALIAIFTGLSTPHSARAATCKEEVAGSYLRYELQSECETAGVGNAMDALKHAGNWILTDDATNMWSVKNALVTASLSLLPRASRVDAILLAEPFGIRVELLCELVETLAGSTIGETGSGKLTLSINTCVVNKPSGCKARTPIEINASEYQEGGENTSTLYLTPEETVFTAITLEGCLLAGTYKLEGQQLCESLNLETEAALHELSCLAAHSELTFGGLPATLEVNGIDLELESSENWSSQAGVVTCKEEVAGSYLRYELQSECETSGASNVMAAVKHAGNWVLTDAATNMWSVNAVLVTTSLNLLSTASTVDAILLGEPLGVKTELLCELVETLAGSTIGETGSGKLTLSINTCVVNKPSGCTAKTPIEINAREYQEGGENTRRVYLIPEETAITLEGCLVAGTYKLEGQQLCESANLETEAALHELSCLAAHSELTFAGLPATLEVNGIDLELESSENWSSRAGGGPCKEEVAGSYLRYELQSECEASGASNVMDALKHAGNWILTDDATNMWSVNNVLVTTSLNLLSTASPVDAILLAEPLGVKTELLCELVETLAGSTIGETGSGKLTLSVNTCVVNKPSGCKARTPIEITAREYQEGGENTRKLYLTPEGTVLTEITLEGCLVAGTNKLEGQQLCESLNLETEAALHELSCAAAHSELTFAGLPATLEVNGIDLELESSENWSS